MLSSHIFLRSVDINHSIISSLPFTISDNPAMNSNSLHHIHVSCEKYTGYIERFIEICLREGFLVESIILLNGRLFTGTFLLPLSFTLHLKLIVHTI